MKAILIGTTGLVGSALTKKLIEDPRFSEVVSISRRPLEIHNTKLKQIIIPNLSQLATKSAQLKGDIYFCCLGTTIKEAGSQENFRKVDFAAVLDFAKIAQAHEAKSFVLISAMGANSKSSIFYNRVKGEIESAIQELHLKSFSIFRPGLLIGERKKLRLGEKIATHFFQTFSVILPMRIQKMFATHAEQLASSMIENGLLARSGVQIIESVDI